MRGRILFRHGPHASRLGYRALATAEDEAREAQHQQDAAKAKALALTQEENTTKTHAENEARERRIASNSAQAAAESRVIEGFQKANLVAIHAGRTYVTPRDLHLVNALDTWDC